MPDLPTRSPGVGLALARATESLLRALGEDDIRVLFPSPMAPDSSAQLGLTAPDVNEVTIAPAAARSLSSDNHQGRLRMQFLFAASVMDSILQAQGMDSAETFFHGALGIVHQGRLLRVEAVEADFIGSLAYLYKVTAVE
jgi:hypothetical protein